MSSMRFNQCLSMSYHGPLHPFRDAGVIVGSLTGIHNAMVKCLFIINRICIHKGFFRCPHRLKSRGFKSAERGGQHWVHLCLSIVGHDRCY
jgi:hypothetical protein